MAKQWPRNLMEVKQFLQPKLETIVETVLEHIKQENISKINEIIYSVNTPAPEGYERTYEFRDNAWSDTITDSSLDEIEGEFKYDPSHMVDIHESKGMSKYGAAGLDEREYLADIIYNGVAGHIFGTGFWTEKRDAWTALIKVVGSDTMKQWIEDGARKARLTITWN